MHKHKSTALTCKSVQSEDTINLVPNCKTIADTSANTVKNAIH